LLNSTESNFEKDDSVFSVSPKNPNKKKDVIKKKIELLMMGHAKTIKTFSTRRQAIAKNKLAKLIGELELEQIDEVTATSSSFQESRYSMPSITRSRLSESMIMQTI